VHAPERVGVRGRELAPACSRPAKQDAELMSVYPDRNKSEVIFDRKSKRKPGGISLKSCAYLFP
jgi:hypothetical protein